MLLSVYLNDYFLSYILLDPVEIKVLKHGIINVPYKADYNDSFLTQKKFIDLLKKDLKDDFSDNIEIIKIADIPEINDILIDLNTTQVQKLLPFNSLIVNHLNNNSVEYLDPQNIDDYYNHRIYHASIDIKIRMLMDSSYISWFVSSNKGNFIKNEKFCIITIPFETDNDRNQYVDKITETFTKNVGIAGMWSINLDDSFVLIPLTAGLFKLGRDISLFYKEHPLDDDIKLIKAPGISEYQIGKIIDTGEEKLKTESLKLESLNKIELNSKQKAHFKWKGDKSKFDGIVNGAMQGIVLDTNVTN